METISRGGRLHGRLRVASRLGCKRRRSLLAVNPLVAVEVTFHVELLVAEGALEGFQVGVDQQVNLQRAPAREALAAKGADLGHEDQATVAARLRGQYGRELQDVLGELRLVVVGTVSATGVGTGRRVYLFVLCRIAHAARAGRARGQQRHGGRAARGRPLQRGGHGIRAGRARARLRSVQLREALLRGRDYARALGVHGGGHLAMQIVQVLEVQALVVRALLLERPRVAREGADEWRYLLWIHKLRHFRGYRGPVASKIRSRFAAGSGLQRRGTCGSNGQWSVTGAAR